MTTTATKHEPLEAAHVDGLAACKTKADAIRYACEVSGSPKTEQVRAWLGRYGVETSRSNASSVINSWRRERGLSDTGDLPPLTDEVLAGITAATSATERVQDTSNASTERVQDASDAFETRRTAPGAWGFYIVAALSLLVSADTSWRLFGWLGITNVYERAALFGVMEAALVACAVALHADVRRSGRPGPARLLAWALCGIAAFGAVTLSGPIAGALRVALGPLLGLVSLHMALGIEIRSRRTHGTMWARVGRELRERVLSRLGLADDERDALARTRDRAARRAARLALAPVWLPFRSARLGRALRASNAAHDTFARERLLAELAALRHASTLTTLDQPSPWSSLESDAFATRLGRV